VAGQAASAVLSIVIAVPLTAGYLSRENTGSWWVLIVCTAIQGAIMSLTQPARIAIIPEMVNKELVLNAISLSQIGATVFGLAGPLLGGYLIDAHGFAIIYYLATASYTISTIVSSFCR
jgi:MFS family permease